MSAETGHTALEVLYLQTSDIIQRRNEQSPRLYCNVDVTLDFSLCSCSESSPDVHPHSLNKQPK